MPIFDFSDVPDSPLARWDPRWKLAALLLAAIGFATLDRPSPCIAALVLGQSLVAFSRLPWRWVSKRLGILAVAAVPFLLILPFTLDPEGPGWNLGPVRLSEHGLVAGGTVFCRCLAIGCLGLVLLGTSPMHHLLAAAHRLWIPGVIVLIAGLAYRYAFLLGDEARRLRVALRTRGFKTRSNRRTYRTLAHVTGAILVRGEQRAERVAAAMRCRGFDGTFRCTQEFRTTLYDSLALLATLAVATGLVLWDKLS